MLNENENPEQGKPSDASLTEDTNESNQDDSTQHRNDNSGDTSNALADSLINSMSDVSEHVIESHTLAESEKIHNNAQTTDKRGDTFNPEQHATDDNGEPKFTAAGYFAKKRGRKQGQTNSIIGTSNKQEQAPQETTAKNNQRMAGRAAASALITLGVVMGGEEWQPIENKEHGINEKDHLQGAFADYFEAKEMDDIPAGIALTIALVGYAAPRFTMPKTQARSKSLFGKIKKWYVNRKLKKHNLKAVDADKQKDKVLEA